MPFKAPARMLSTMRGKGASAALLSGGALDVPDTAVTKTMAQGGLARRDSSTSAAKLDVLLQRCQALALKVNAAVLGPHDAPPSHPRARAEHPL